MNFIIIGLILGCLIFVHELGHFLAARWTGIPVARFSVGFGKAIWKTRLGETEFRLAMLPIGGYVLPKLSNGQLHPQAPVWRRMVFTIGGPLANVLICIPLFALLNLLSGESGFFALMISPWLQTFSTMMGMFQMLPTLFSNPESLTSVIGIFTEGSQALSGGWNAFLSISIILSINFAVLNLLPVPPLDGGKLLLYALEPLHPVMTRLSLPLHLAGWIAILGLMIYAVMLDIHRYFGGS